MCTIRCRDREPSYRHPSLTCSYSYTFDLHDALPCDDDHRKYWDDAIHFTPEGYTFIGDRVGCSLMGIIVAERTKAE
jgi:hypothetical protein